VSNLTDESYLNNYSGNLAGFGFVGVSRNEPRTFGLSVTYNFE
jgi:outer membrane receptor protein involved in Fe transport